MPRWTRADTNYLLLLLTGFVLGTWIGWLWGGQASNHTASLQQERGAYQYAAYQAADGTLLHTMRTSPDNVKLLAIGTNVTDTDEYGINGGFFWNGDLLSIAVEGDLPLKGQPHDYGSGWSNIDVPKGTLVWDKQSRQFSVQIVEAANQLQVSDRGRYWAQGGVSMSLQAEDRWRSQAIAEDMPLIDQRRLRSAAVYDSDGQLWMIVSDKPSTTSQFRQAILETVAPGKLVDGVFLDGDGSSQMRNAETKLLGDRRAVYQMMSLIRQSLDR
ncbi:phosphodiester glycosidase family protein [Paenibacillus filicis]|uniref:Phosphodiester glycosidase family protein n=1 Tax=Paenibacillus filicis TaxID=669464 RepID=A0ABU9DKZ3_9BACL